MATFSANHVPTTLLSFAELSTQEAGLIDGTKWGDGGYGHGVQLTYSFPWGEGSAPYFSHADYGAYDNEWLRSPGVNSSYALDAVERTAVRNVLNGVELAANITF